MRRFFMALPLMLAGCGVSWPSGSYVADISDADAKTLAPTIADYVARAVPSNQDVHLVTAGAADPIEPIVAANLDREGIGQDARGQPVRYVAAPVDGGVLLRISIGDTQGGSLFYTRAANGNLVPAGPMMVAMP
jgi:hypothetical protein